MLISSLKALFIQFEIFMKSIRFNNMATCATVQLINIFLDP